MGAGQAGKPDHEIRGLALSHLTLAQPLGREGELETEFNHVINDIINYG